MNVVSVDLAVHRYSDFGFAFLERGARKPVFTSADDLKLSGKPDAEILAHRLHEFCQARDISVLLLDGPQGWRHPDSPIDDMRLAERVLNTPARTGPPGQVKPKTYFDFVQFSIDLFQELRTRYGWSLLTEDWPKRKMKKWAVEVFPSSAWVLQGMAKLPSKGKARRADIDRWAANLASVQRLDIPAGLSHDQLQAAVTLPCGRAIARRKRKDVFLCGYDPILPADGLVYEGWIANPLLRERR